MNLVSGYDNFPPVSADAYIESNLPMGAVQTALTSTVTVPISPLRMYWVISVW